MFFQHFDPLTFIILILSLLPAITIHEFSHAFVADRLGDPTARIEGRLTLNPLSHLDPLGTIMLFLVFFGWGKPVPVDPFNLRNPRRDYALISLAGPASNILLAVVLAIIMRLTFFSPFLNVLTIAILKPFITISLALAVFNLVPIYPLDGFKIVQGFLPENLALEWETLKEYGLMLLILILFPLPGGSLVGKFLMPVLNFAINILIPLT